jgi:hypothetical protein
VLPDGWTEIDRWTYSSWKPGAPCPATRRSVREIQLDRDGELLLAVSPIQHVLWLYDARTMVTTLVPVTNFYNELMMLKGVRDPKIALDHKRLFTELDGFTVAELRDAFFRYNGAYRKVAPERLFREESRPERESLVARIVGIFKGGR